MSDLPLPPRSLKLVTGEPEFFSPKERDTARRAFVAAHQMCTLDEKGQKRAVDGSLPLAMTLWAAIQILSIKKGYKEHELEKLVDETSKLLAEANNAVPPEQTAA